MSSIVGIIKDYFIDPDINIPNPSSVETGLNRYIDIYEKQILELALGYQLYKEFKTALAGTPAQKWIDLRDGKDYTVDGSLVHWNGLVNAEKISLIAYYVFFNWYKDKTRLKSSSGTVLAKHDNGKGVNPRIELVNAFNKCFELYGKDLSILDGSDFMLRGRRYQERYLNNISQFQDDYEEEKLKPTLFNFLYFTNKNTPGTYENWKFTPLGDINNFGI